MLIDTHSHLNFSSFDNDREEVIKRSLENDVWVINVGTNYYTSKQVIELAEKYPQGVYATAGLHPINLDTGLVKIKFDKQEGKHLEKKFDFERYKRLAQSKKVVAIGEVGLDYYWRPKTTGKKKLFKEKQKNLLLEELKLAKELELPVIFHCRMAHQDLIEFLRKNSVIRPKRAVAHSFVGSLEQLKEYLDFGFYIGFTGIIFKKIESINFEKSIKNTPLERILIETDCPYLTTPNFPNKRNNPLGVKYVAQRVAEIKNATFGKIAEITTHNARELFKL
jgi:TatD DNase family protein